MLDDIDDWQGSPPKSPDQVRERNQDELIIFADDKQERVVSDIRPSDKTRPQFDLSNQIRELRH